MRFVGKVVDVKATKKFMLDAQKDDDEGDKLIFHIRESLTNSELKYIKSMLISDQVEASDVAFEMVVSDVENFFFEDGEPVKIEREKHKYAGVYRKLTEECATAIPDVAKLEIATHIYDNYFELTETDTKN